ncbi:hypothetical protein AB4099_18885 [Bosea sp. 2KB_26]|uniref:hypothetical protein n=1 Tax=Bosea sp. 2KB_26 TaxID=3237475 RepID=UPI003F92357C
MSTPIVVDIGAVGFNLILATDRYGAGDAKITWTTDANLNPDFDCGRKSPAVALEMALGRVERNGFVSPLDFSLVMGVLVGFLEGRARL